MPNQTVTNVIVAVLAVAGVILGAVGLTAEGDAAAEAADAIAQADSNRSAYSDLAERHEGALRDLDVITGRLDERDAHCQEALEVARAQHVDLQDDLADNPDDEALEQRVREDAQRQVCGVRVHDAVTGAGQSMDFADFLR